MIFSHVLYQLSYLGTPERVRADRTINHSRFDGRNKGRSGPGNRS